MFWVEMVERGGRIFAKIFVKNVSPFLNLKCFKQLEFWVHLNPRGQFVPKLLGFLYVLEQFEELHPWTQEGRMKLSDTEMKE